MKKQPIEQGKMRRDIQDIEELLTKTGISYKIVNYSPEVKNAREATKETGLDLEKMVKTLIFKSGDKYLALLISSPSRVNIQVVNQKLASKISMASVEEILKVTGCVIGSVTVLGLKDELPIYIDSAIMDYDAIGIASGVKGVEILVSPDDLKKVTGAEIMDLS